MDNKGLERGIMKRKFNQFIAIILAMVMVVLGTFQESVFYASEKENDVNQTEAAEETEDVSDGSDIQIEDLSFDSKDNEDSKAITKEDESEEDKAKENISEKILQKLILENIPLFLEELGEGFTFIKNEYKIKLDDRYNYIDLLLYNIKYKCYVVVELKVTELKKEHTGQIMTYMNYIDKNIKSIEENATVGIIICKQDNEYVIKYCSDNRIISRVYKLV